MKSIIKLILHSDPSSSL